MSKSLPAQANLRQLKIQAKELLASLRSQNPGSAPKLAEAQRALAREYGFPSWIELKREAEKREGQSVDSILPQLRSAVRNGDVQALQKLLGKHPPLQNRINDPLFDFGGTAILNAVARKDRPMIDALIEAGADLNRKSEWGPGGFGVLDRVDDELGGYLISRGAGVDIHAAANLGRVERIQELLDADPCLVNARGGDGGTPLHFARNVAVADLLLRRGADVTLRDRDHHSTAAMWQVENKPVLDRLIAAGSPVDIFMACAHGDEELARRALREDPACLSSFISHGNGEGKFAPDTGGNIYSWSLGHAARPIAVAQRRGHHALVDFLMARATPVERLIAFCLAHHRRAVAELLGADPGIISRLTPEDARALPDAIHYRDRDAAKLMFAAGFPVTAEGPNRMTALDLAAWHGDAELVQLALEKGAALEDRDNDFKTTPLGAACHGSVHAWDREKGDYPATVAALIRAGAETREYAERKRSGAVDWASAAVIATFP